MTSSLKTWALPQLSRLLALDEDSLDQVITYTDTLPKDAAAEHLKNLLGDSPKAIEFITSFNGRRQTPPSAAKTAVPQSASSAGSEVPRTRAKTAKSKKKGPLHALEARQLQRDDGPGDTAAYRKRDEEDYMAASSRQRRYNEPSLAKTLALQEKPDAMQLPTVTAGGASRSASSRLPPSAAGSLVSDMLPSANSSRSSSPAPAKTKVAITGGTNMHGAASTLSDLDSAIRSLEIQTNPTSAQNSQSPADLAKRRCNCMAARHPLLTIAPNCMSCGKIICVKEGLGPCTYCNSPLLSHHDITSMVRVLKDERGKERMAANNAVHRRAEVSVKPRAFTGRDFLSSSAAASTTPSPLSSAPPSDDDEEEGKFAKAKDHRDRLLAFQAQNARRTRIHDEAADFDIPTSGTNMWASPAERATQLKRQQKVLREMEWSARPEWEKRRVVASIDVAGGKIVKRMAEMERPQHDEDVNGNDEEVEVLPAHAKGDTDGTGAFSQNPLMGALIRPIARTERQNNKDADVDRASRSTWRRVQDDNNDNEQWILDGGAYGGRTDGRVLGAEEHSHG